MKPIERAAMALWQLDQVPQDASPAMTPPETSDWRDYIPKARAVIEAIREPSDAMKLAGAFCEPFLTEAGKKPYTPGQIIATECYASMIDALLAE